MDNPITANGVRPRVLAPPPSISLPRRDKSYTTWGIMSSFALDLNIDLFPGRERDYILCASNTTNDDDCWSLATETSNISLNDRFSPIVGNWVKCQILGRGSCGSVYEGIADEGFFMAVKEVSLLDQGDQGRQSISQLEQVVKRNDQGYGLPADIWSLGCTVLEMLTRQIPYADFEFMQALFQIGRGVPPPVPDSLSSDAWDFILRCLQVSPNDRPTAADLLDHPYVRRPLPSSSGSSSPYNFG